MEVVDGPERIAELGPLAPSFEYAVGAARQLVSDRASDPILGRQRCGLPQAIPASTGVEDTVESSYTLARELLQAVCAL
ncbi:MAG: hypothetical protein ACLQVG_24270 [Terriglobia bacterium]